MFHHYFFELFLFIVGYLNTTLQAKTFAMWFRGPQKDKERLEIISYMNHYRNYENHQHL